MDAEKIPGWVDPEVPPEPGTCRSCRADIWWVVALVSRKRSPLDADGTSHFATCPDAARWRR